MRQNDRIVDNVYRYSRRGSQLCVMISYLDIRVINHLSEAFNIMKKDYIESRAKIYKRR